MKEREKIYSYNWLNKYFGLKLVGLLYLWYIAYVCFDVVKDIEPLKTFIPHEILGVATDATKG